MKRKLKPCPFCGGEAELVQRGTRRQSAQISCTNCGCFFECGAETEEGWIDRWNERTIIDHKWYH